MDSRRNLPERFAGVTAAPPLDDVRREWVKQLAERVSRGIENDWPHIFTDCEFEPMIDARFAEIKRGFDRIHDRQARR